MNNHKIYFVANSDSDMLGTFEMELSVLGPRLTKNLLKLVAISLSSSMILPPIFNWEVLLESFFTFF